ncbi:hydrogenase accessory protein hypb [Lucifera butyrica]|uniref:Hydrogenase accessory protein hypb n=1 Tax=Lucifera butyrica TaxID=1351585 RepID=A0A498R2C8_9FIRM|nr:hydrogenase nickel incorporation protein HypB [Lucifera butyrica]VBB05319.1 hydrogenase accessory protein hypb [Lucifera butyrica]
MKIEVKENILRENDRIAAGIRAELDRRGIFALNLLGSPGSGKTSLLENTLSSLRETVKLAVIEGDLFTSKDAIRLQKYNVPVIQINTGGGCHLDANMVRNAINTMELDNLELLIIENVGNLVCPAEFNIGEDAKATVLSITEGEDKPLKYPLIFKESVATIVNKIDLLPFTDFNLDATLEDIRSLNPHSSLLQVSCRTGEGLPLWYDWLLKQVSRKRSGMNG